MDTVFHKGKEQPAHAMMLYLTKRRLKSMQWGK